MKNKLKKILQFILNPRLLLCVLIAWIITNGWSYVLFGIGLRGFYEKAKNAIHVRKAKRAALQNKKANK